MHQRVIQLKQILKQLKDDLIGKDSYRGVTFTYSWLANQFGHFSLGFIPTLIVYTLLKNNTTWNNLAFWAAIFVSTTWLLFETYNFLGPLLLNKRTDANHIYLPSNEGYIFKPDYANVAFDTITDLLFFWMGAFVSSLFIEFSWAVMITILSITFIIMYPAYYWFVTKMYLQYARFPIQIRLSQWKSKKALGETDVKTVKEFISKSKKSSGNHLLIFGGRRTGKSSLSVAIGSEISIKHLSCSYYTAMKLFNLFTLNEEEIIESEDCKAWSWRSSSLLIIDDINPGRPIQNIYLSQEDIISIVKMPVSGDVNRNKEDLKNKNVIWVIGDGESNDADNWIEMLKQIGIDTNNIKSIGLGFLFLNT